MNSTVFGMRLTYCPAWGQITELKGEVFHDLRWEENDEGKLTLYAELFLGCEEPIAEVVLSEDGVSWDVAYQDVYGPGEDQYWVVNEGVADTALTARLLATQTWIEILSSKELYQKQFDWRERGYV